MTVTVRAVDDPATLAEIARIFRRGFERRRARLAAEAAEQNEQQGEAA